MKKIYLITFLSLFIFSCTSDDSDPDMQVQLPTIENISTTTANVGEVITIMGKNFDSDQTYIVKFNTVEGEVVEVKPTFLKAEIPENATSGDVTLSVNNETTIVGTLVIEEQVQDPIFGDFVEINTTIGETITISGTFFDLDKANYIAKFNGLEGTIIEVAPTFLKVVTPEGTTAGLLTIEFVKGFSYEVATIIIFPTVSVPYTLHAIKDFPGQSNTTTSKFVTINPESGVETDEVDLMSTQFFESLTYDNQGIIMAISSFTDINDNITNTLYKIPISGGAFTSFGLDADVYYEIIMSNNGGTLYAVKDSPGQSNTITTKLVAIDVTTGMETEALDLETTNTVESLVYDAQNNQIFAISSFTDANDNITNKLLNIDLTNNTSTAVDLSNDVYYEIVISDNGILYGTKDYPGQNNSTTTKFVTINPDGSETNEIDLMTTGFLESLVFDGENNQIIAIGSLTDANDNITNKLYKIKLSNYTFNSTDLSNDVYYELGISF